MSGSIPLCSSDHVFISVSICILSISVGMLFHFTFNVLFTRSITTGLFSSFVGLSGSSAYITLPSCCKYNILEFSSNGLNHIIPSNLSRCKPSFALFITNKSCVSLDFPFWNSSNCFAFFLSPYSPSIELNFGIMFDPSKYFSNCFW